MLSRLSALVLYVTILVVVSVLPGLAQPPQIQSGLNYLVSSQNTDGTWATGTMRVETTAATVSVLETMKSLGQPNSAYTNAVAWLQNQTPISVDYQAQRIHALGLTDTSINTLIPQLDLLKHAWGGDEEFVADNLDTASALLALKAANYTDQTVISGAITYLLSTQNTDGGWGFAKGDDSNVYMTAIVSVTLQQFSRTTVLATAISRAITYLFVHQNTDGGFGRSSSTVYETALAFKALFGVTIDATTLARTLNYLTSSQSADGSWSQDPYSTALALQALYLSDSRPPVPPPTPTAGTVSGTVLDATTNQHLNDVTVTLASNPAITARTDGTGAFSLANVPQGAQQLSFSLNGYATSTATVTVTAGSIVNIGSIPLSVVPTTGIIQGTVTDASTGGPLSGVEITVTGVTTSTAVTATNGFYKITGITPGNISITASKAGFLQITGAGTITAGGTLIFSPALSTTPPVATTGGLSGTVIDSRTSLPIQGATISVVGAKIYTAITDLLGKFILPTMDAAGYTVSISAVGYVTQTYSVSIIAGNAINLGNIPLAITTTTGTVQGKVTDASSSAPLADVTITVSGSTTWTAVTAADGSYTVTGITPGAITISAAKTGYYAASGASTIASGLTIVFSPALPTTPPTEITEVLKGTVIDSLGPIQGATISISGRKNYAATTSAAGEFLVSAMDADTYTVSVSAPSHVSQSYSVTILSRVTTNMGAINLLPSPTSGSITGIVTDSATGGAIAGVTVSVIGASNWQAVTRSDGTYQILDITPGAVTISAAKNGYNTVSGSGDVTAGAKLTFSPALQQLPTTGEIKGKVVDVSTGTPLQTASITVASSPPGVDLHGSPDASGNFFMTAINPGSYTVAFAAPGYSGQTYTVTVMAGVTADVGAVSLTPVTTSNTITGKVVDVATGASIANAEVSITGTTTSTKTDTNGAYTISGIAQSNFILQASADGYDSLIQYISLNTYGAYSVNFSLAASHASDLKITALSTDKQNYSSYAPVSISADVLNSGNVLISGTVSVSIENGQGEVVDYLQASTLDANGVAQNHFDFEPGNTASINIPWDTKALPPGAYAIVVKVLKGDAGVGGGTIVSAEKATSLVIDPTQAIASLVLTPLPRFTNVGASEQISLMAALANRSNVATTLDIAYEWRSPSGALLKSGTGTITLLPAETSKTVSINTFPFMFTESGDHPVSSSIGSGPTPTTSTGGIISAAPGIRIEPSQNITPMTVVPDGDKRIHLDIRLKGVEVKQ